jgi:hypothetical protein
VVEERTPEDTWKAMAFRATLDAEGTESRPADWISPWRAPHPRTASWGDLPHPFDNPTAVELPEFVRWGHPSEDPPAPTRSR